MKNLILGIMAAFLMAACSGTASSDVQATGDTYNVAVDNNGDGDIVIITGDGTITTNEQDECIVRTETTLSDGTVETSERNCNEDEVLIQENALYDYAA